MALTRNQQAHLTESINRAFLDYISEVNGSNYSNDQKHVDRCFYTLLHSLTRYREEIAAQNSSDELARKGS
jgi:hypothetical protein